MQVGRHIGFLVFEDSGEKATFFLFLQLAISSLFDKAAVQYGIKVNSSFPRESVTG